MPGVKLEGVLAAMVTPFDANGDAIDRVRLTSLTQQLIGAGIGGLVPCGSTGEFTSMSKDERKLTIEVVIEAAQGRVPVVPHTGALTTAEALELSKHAEETGAAAVMVVTPFYEALTWPEVKAYYVEIASAVEIPIMLYHIPSATGQKLTPDQLAELASVGGVDFVKDSSGDGVLLAGLLHRFGSSDFNVLNGWDSLTFQGFAGGASACVWGAANVIPELCVSLFEALHSEGDLARGRMLWRHIWPVCHFFETHGYVASVKAGCEIVGRPMGAPRSPVQELQDGEKQALAALLIAAGVASADTGTQIDDR